MLDKPTVAESEQEELEICMMLNDTNEGDEIISSSDLPMHGPLTLDQIHEASIHEALHNSYVVRLPTSDSHGDRGCKTGYHSPKSSWRKNVHHSLYERMREHSTYVPPKPPGVVKRMINSVASFFRRLSYKVSFTTRAARERKELIAQIKKSKKYYIPAIKRVSTTAQGSPLAERIEGPYILIRKSQASGSDHWSNDHWELHIRKTKQNKKQRKQNKYSDRALGSFHIGMPQPEKDILGASMQNSSLNQSLHGLGLGKIIYGILTEHYGVFESDSRGMTSDQAQRVWRSLGAKKIGKRFRLEANKLDKKYSSMK